MATTTAAHTCNAQCWAEAIRYGLGEGCDPWVARAAAEQEAFDEGAIWDV